MRSTRQASAQVYDAENVQSSEVMALRIKLAVIERLEGIIRESAKPLSGSKASRSSSFPDSTEAAVTEPAFQTRS
jgi:hypothetical protein